MARTQFTKAVLITGFVAGTLDAAAASIQYSINTGKNPARVFRYIASAVFGKDAITKDLYAMAAWGLLFHFLIAISFTLFFFACFRQIRKLVPNKYAAGIAYGIFAWIVMNFLVVPLAFKMDIGQYISLLFSPAKLKNSLIAMGILIIAIGLPISLLADRYYSKRN